MSGSRKKTKKQTTDGNCYVCLDCGKRVYQGQPVCGDCGSQNIGYFPAEILYKDGDPFYESSDPV